MHMEEDILIIERKEKTRDKGKEENRKEYNYKAINYVKYLSPSFKSAVCNILRF